MSNPRVGDLSASVAVSVRMAGVADADAVVDLWARVFPGDPSRNAPGPMLERKLAVDDLVWVAEEGGKVVGAVAAGYDGVRGWVYHLAVDPGYRRRGIGEALMRAAEDALVARGCPKINLQVRSTNAAVVAFYESLGYTVEDRVSLGKVLGEG